MKKILAKIHLYLGLFFSPLIILYSFSGALQIFRFHKSMKDGSYEAPKIFIDLSNIHIWQRAPEAIKTNDISFVFFQWLSFTMAIGLIITGILGMILAFQRTPKHKLWVPAAILFLGLIIPFLILIMQAS
ncbi:MAG: hypothetical protein KDI90_11245 [Alphaproteobacteria bacterium]|nr:hypothetical protein [Alphaproteobacteria bacterium]MCB9975883.1 hypothetical protein [Rhodospirillales bacterium]